MLTTQLAVAQNDQPVAKAQAVDAAAKILPAGFMNHGIAARVSESRGVLTARDKSGVPLIVAFARDRTETDARNSLLVIDARNGKTDQYWYPKRESGNGDIFSLMRAADGRIYTTTGNTFLEFDLEKREWTFNGPTDGMAMSFAQSPNGLVYFGTYPNSTLFRFNPATRSLEKLGNLDPQEKYPSFLAASDDGWVYAGIGTARSNLVGFNTTTGERVQLADESTRKTGGGWVMVSSDGNIYGRGFSSSDSPLLKLEGGRATPVPSEPLPPKAVTGAINWQSKLDEFPGGGKIVSFSIPEKNAVVELDGKTQRITFDYESNGAGISSFIAGPDGKLYGSTNHPMHFFAYDPATTTLTDHGTIPQIGGGNFPTFSVSGKYLVGDSYSAGAVYEYDTTQPWQINEDGTTVNPRLLGKFKDVTRPRASVALPNGDIVFGGYGGYGVTGGGLITYDAAKREARAKPSAQLIPNQSTVAMRLLNPNTVVGGTTIDAPGGGRVLAKEAELFLLDVATQTVTFRTVPIEGARSIFAIEVAPDGKVYGLTNNSQFFVFDPASKTVIHRADWKEWGSPFNPGNSLWRGPNGNVHVLVSKFVLEIQPDYSVRKLTDLPVPATDGAVLLNGRMYFASGPQLLSIDLSTLAP